TVSLDQVGNLVIYRGAIGGTVLASTVISPLSIWRYIEAAVTISDTVGTVEVHLDGSATPILSFTGDTKNAGTNTTIDACALYGVNSGNSPYFDDWYVCDTAGTINNTFLGDVRVYTLAPNGAGNYTQFVPSTGSNYTCVDEQPYNTTDYVGSPTTGNRDSYALTDLPATVATVFGTSEIAVVEKSDAGAAAIKQSMRVGLTDYDTAATNLATSWTSLRNLRETNPNTGVAWTAAGVNGAEMGVTVG
ncbi:MAG TPA: hypothetical protein VLS51_12130, partial [Propionibacteriaceae bacterium]|nr:hypothetical protein [Propionibacteriaceae bacterium]